MALRAVQAYNAYLLGLEQRTVAEKVGAAEGEAARDGAQPPAAGVATDLDVLRFEVDLENARTTLLRLQGAADLARGDLNAVMVQPIDTPIEPTDALDFVDETAEQRQVVQEAARAGPRSRRSPGTRRSTTRRSASPRRTCGRASTSTAPSAGRRASPRTSSSTSFEKWSLGVTLKIPVFDGLRTAGRVAQARADAHKVAQDRIALENQIRLEAKEAVDRLRVAASVYHAADLNVAQARKALEMTEANYKLGAATTLDVLDAQAALTQAESNRIQALYAHANARAGLRYVMAATRSTPAARSCRPRAPRSRGPS